MQVKFQMFYATDTHSIKIPTEHHAIECKYYPFILSSWTFCRYMKVNWSQILCTLHCFILEKKNIDIAFQGLMQKSR